jgi:excisionase family DNA binding protein
MAMPFSPLLTKRPSWFHVYIPATRVGLEVDTVYKKSRLREVPCVKVGRALRFDVKALERYIEQHTIETID